MLKVKNCIKLFSELNYGDTFRLNGQYYIYTNAIGREPAYASDRGCAINLENGFAAYMHEDIEVEPVDFTISIHEEIIAAYNKAKEYCDE